MPHQYNSTKPDNVNSERYKATRNVTLVGALTNAVLAIVQLVGGVFTHSHALIADGVHTLSDLATDFVVLIAAKMASEDADEAHPYGHGRIETVAAVILGVALVLVAAGIAFDAVQRIFSEDRLMQPTALGLIFALIAIVAKESLYQLTRSVGKKVNSQLLIANAWHHRADALSSLIVLIGIAGAVFFKLPWLDALAAILVAIMISYMGIKMLIESFSELIDTALAPERLQEISDHISQQDGVQNVHMLRTRSHGGSAYADVHIEVEPTISVSEGHFIAERVMHDLLNNFDELEDITVHIDSEDDETSSPSKDLSSRKNLQNRLLPVLSELGYGADDDMRLHYVDGAIDLELILKGVRSDSEKKGLRRSCLEVEGVRKVKVLIEH